MMQENRHRVKVLVFNGDLVWLTPLDGHVPGREQLGWIVQALEIGFDAYLEHDPIKEYPDG